MSADSHAAIEAVWRLEAPKLTAGLMRLVRDLGAAEDLAHDALVAALEQWPAAGVPRNPGAWLMQAAKRRVEDFHRRRAFSSNSTPCSVSLRGYDSVCHGSSFLIPGFGTAS